MKEKIIDASVQLFDEKGFSETSIQDIVNVIGVTKGTFYYYFQSKQELLKDIHLRYIEDLLTKQSAILGANMDVKSKIHQIIYMLIKNIKTKRQSARIFFREMRNLSDDHIDQIMKKRDLFRIHFQGLIETGIENGSIKETFRADMLTFGILGVTNWSYYWYNPDGPVGEKELSDLYLEMILNGISSGEDESPM